MYQNLPRHTFGYIQGKLFPKYFLLGTILSSVTIATYIVKNPINAWERQQMIQVGTMLGCYTSRLYSYQVMLLDKSPIKLYFLGGQIRGHVPTRSLKFKFLLCISRAALWL